MCYDDTGCTTGHISDLKLWSIGLKILGGQFYFGNKLLSMAAMEGVEDIPVLFVAWNQPDVFELGTSFKFQYWLESA